MNDVGPHIRQLGAILLGSLVLFAIGVAAYSWDVNYQLANNYAAATHSYAVANKAEALMARITDGETGERGFLITGREVYLEPYVIFSSTVDQIYADLVALTADDPAQSGEMALLRPVLLARKEEFKSIIQLRRDGGLDAARTSASFDSGKRLHDEIRRIMHRVSTAEWETIGQRNAVVASASGQSRRGIALVTAAVAILGCAILILGWWTEKLTGGAPSHGGSRGR